MERVKQIGFPELSRRDRAVVDEFAARLGELHRLNPAKVEKCLIDYARSYWPSYDAPIFKGFESSISAKRVIRLLQALKVPLIRVVCFAPPDSAVAARWERLLGWPRQRMSFRRPPNGASAAARRWIAIEPIFPVLREGCAARFRASKGFPLLVRYAAQVILLERQATRATPNEPGDVEQDE